jgi:hypothetical protein
LIRDESLEHAHQLWHLFTFDSLNTFFRISAQNQVRE